MIRFILHLYVMFTIVMNTMRVPILKDSFSLILVEKERICVHFIGQMKSELYADRLSF
jgi:hypothetical protein